jgi:hypothetical protein
MKIDKTPAERIYDLIEAKDFEKLNDFEKEFVLQHMTKADFCNMREAKKILGDSIKNQKDIVLPTYIKSNLQQAFKEKTNSNPFLFTVRRNVWDLMKVAAVLILVFSSAFVIQKYLSNRIDNTVYITKHDTIYVDNSTEVVKVFDTVIVYKSISSDIASRKSKTTYDDVKSIDTSVILPSVTNFGIENLRNLRENAINKLGRSAAEDSLLKNIGFVRM